MEGRDVPHPVDFGLLCCGWGWFGRPRSDPSAARTDGAPEHWWLSGRKLWVGRLLLAVGPGPVGFDFDLSCLSCEPVAVAAPRPVCGAFNEAAFDWVAVNVAELFPEFGLGEDVEVVIAALPELFAVGFEALGGFVFEDVESGAEEVGFGFREEQVDVFGHEDVAEDVEVVGGAEFFELVEEGGAGAVVVEEGKTAVTTEGDEVFVA